MYSLGRSNLSIEAVDGATNKIEKGDVAMLHKLGSVSVQQDKRIKNWLWRQWSVNKLFSSSEQISSCAASKFEWRRLRKQVGTPDAKLRRPTCVESAALTGMVEEAISISTALLDSIPPAQGRLELEESRGSVVSTSNRLVIDPQEISALTREPVYLWQAHSVSPASRAVEIQNPIQTKVRTEPDGVVASSAPPWTVARSPTFDAANITAGDHVSPSVDSEAGNATEASSHSIVKGFLIGQVIPSCTSSTWSTSEPQAITNALSIKAERHNVQKGNTGWHDDPIRESPEAFARSRMDSSSRSSSSAGLLMTSKGKQVPCESASSIQVCEDVNEEEMGPSESAIEDDDDEGEWEDFIPNVNELAPVQAVFKRVKSCPGFVPRQAMLTAMISKLESAAIIRKPMSQSIFIDRRSPQPSRHRISVATSPQEASAVTVSGTGYSPARRIISGPSHTRPPILSPRTIHQYLYKAELSESIRINLLREHQVTTTSSNVLEGRHTSHGVQKLEAFSAPLRQPKLQPGKDTVIDGSYSNRYFDNASSDYHSNGW